MELWDVSKKMFSVFSMIFETACESIATLTKLLICKLMRLQISEFCV